MQSPQAKNAGASAQEKVRRYFREVTERHQLPALPLVANKVLEMIDDTDVNARKLCRILSDDVAIAARVLAVSRSAYYARRNLPKTLLEAVQTLGFRTVSNVVIATATQSLCLKGNRLSEKLWDHSLAVALAARILSRRVGSGEEEPAFLAGLMHDVGEMILVYGDPAGFEQLAQEVRQEKAPLLEKEQEAYGFDHTLIGMTLLDAWNIDVQIGQAVLNHHNYDETDDPEALPTIVRLSDYFSSEAGLGFLAEPPLPPAQLMNAVGCDNEEGIANLICEIRAAHAEESALFHSA